MAIFNSYVNLPEGSGNPWFPTQFDKCNLPFSERGVPSLGLGTSLVLVKYLVVGDTKRKSNFDYTNIWKFISSYFNTFFSVGEVVRTVYPFRWCFYGHRRWQAALQRWQQVLAAKAAGRPITSRPMPWWSTRKGDVKNMYSVLNNVKLY